MQHVQAAIRQTDAVSIHAQLLACRTLITRVHALAGFSLQLVILEVVGPPAVQTRGIEFVFGSDLGWVRIREETRKYIVEMRIVYKTQVETKATSRPWQGRQYYYGISKGNT